MYLCVSGIDFPSDGGDCKTFEVMSSNLQIGTLGSVASGIKIVPNISF
jgi:hypothetical protein